jgi:hypothetical protein
MTRIAVFTILLALLDAGGAAAEEAEKRIAVDQAFLKEHAEKIKIQTVAKGESLFPFIHVDAEFFKNHVKTWAHIKSKSGELILALPLDYNETTDGKSRILIFQFSKTDVRPESELELNFRNGEEDVIYVIPFTLFKPDKTFEP